MTPRSYDSLSTKTAEPEAVTRLTVRAWVDPGYRTETVRWRERLEAQLDRASAMAMQSTPMEFQLVAASEWSPQATELPELLQELSEHDDGEGVDLVVAMTGSLPSLTQSQHSLGYANVLGKHIVVRAMNDAAERNRFDEQFDRLKETERRALYRDRLRHKEAAVFLHEVGHAFGALHTRADGWLMSPEYDLSGDRFCDPNERIVSQTILLPREDLSDWTRQATDVVQQVAGSSDADILDRSVVDQLGAVRNELRREDVEKLERSQKLAERGELDEARALADELVRSLPNHPAVVSHDCHLSLLIDSDSEVARRACERASEVAPDSFAATLNRGVLHHRRGEHAEAAALVFRAHELLTTSDHPSASQWLALANAYVGITELTRAEQVLQEVPMVRAADQVRETISTVRGQLCVARGSIPVDEEGAFVRRVMTVGQTAFGDGGDGDEERLNALISEYPDHPGTLALDCVRAFSAGNGKRGESLCGRALAADGRCAIANAVLGRYELARRRYSAARKHLEAARAVVGLDPMVAEPLRKTYEALGDEEALEALSE